MRTFWFTIAIMATIFVASQFAPAEAYEYVAPSGSEIGSPVLSPNGDLSAQQYHTFKYGVQICISDKSGMKLNCWWSSKKISNLKWISNQTVHFNIGRETFAAKIGYAYAHPIKKYNSYPR